MRSSENRAIPRWWRTFVPLFSRKTLRAWSFRTFGILFINFGVTFLGFQANSGSYVRNTHENAPSSGNSVLDVRHVRSHDGGGHLFRYSREKR